MQHLIWHDEPRCGETFGDRNCWEVTRVQHHGGTRRYTLTCRNRFSQGNHTKEFTAEVR